MRKCLECDAVIPPNEKNIDILYCAICSKSQSSRVEKEKIIKKEQVCYQSLKDFLPRKLMI